VNNSPYSKGFAASNNVGSLQFGQLINDDMFARFKHVRVGSTRWQHPLIQLATVAQTTPNLGLPVYWGPHLT
jgi:hypothetical protein